MWWVLLPAWAIFAGASITSAKSSSNSSYNSASELTSTSIVLSIVTLTVNPTPTNSGTIATYFNASGLLSTSNKPPPATIQSKLSTSTDAFTSVTTTIISAPPSNYSSSFIFGTTTLSINGLSTASQTTTTLAGLNTPTILPVFPCPPCNAPSNVIIVFPVGPIFPPLGIDIPPPPGLVPIHIGTDGSATPEPNLPGPTLVPPAPGNNPGPSEPTTPSPPDNSPTTQQTTTSEVSTSQSEASTTSSSTSSSSIESTVTVTGVDNWPAINTALAASLGQVVLAQQSSFYACATPVGLFSFTGSCAIQSAASSTSTTSQTTQASLTTLTTSTTTQSATSSGPPPSSISTTFSCMQPRPTDAPSSFALLSSLFDANITSSTLSTISTTIDKFCSRPGSQIFPHSFSDLTTFIFANNSFYVTQIGRTSATEDLQSCATGFGAVVDCVANQGFYGGLWETENEFYNLTNPEAPKSPFASAAAAADAKSVPFVSM